MADQTRLAINHQGDGAITDPPRTPRELRESIAYIRSLPTGYRWSWRTLRRERYGPDPLLLSWLSHVEDLLDERTLRDTENRRNNTQAVLAAYKAHHEHFHPDCSIGGPSPVPRPWNDRPVA
ncbi:MAG TPA: hypothetical protein VFK52_00205 [Nocardioidaceae bacterium]|nr:hypothetical protein [Nocardioidaceae bacterium]